eukprot:7529053-Pyramimonas_sp.AAC.1
MAPFKLSHYIKPSIHPHRRGRDDAHSRAEERHHEEVFFSIRIVRLHDTSTSALGALMTFN